MPSTTWAAPSVPSTTWTSLDVVPTAYRFDYNVNISDDNRIQIGAIPFSTTKFTLMVWFKLHSLPTGIVYPLFTATTSGVIGLEVSGTHLYAENVPGFGATTGVTDTLTIDVWYKGTLVYDGTLAAANRIKLFLSTLTSSTWSADVDVGRTLVSGSIPTTLTVTGDSYMGTTSGVIDYDLQEVRVFKAAALTLAEVQAEVLGSAPVQAGISHQWKLNGVLTDEGPDGALTGTIVGNVYAVDAADNRARTATVWTAPA